MPTIVTLPDGTELEFPDGVSEAQMRAAIEAQFPDLKPQAASVANDARQPGFFERAGSAVGSAVGDAVDAVRGAFSSPKSLISQGVTGIQQQAARRADPTSQALPENRDLLSGSPDFRPSRADLEWQSLAPAEQQRRIAEKAPRPQATISAAPERGLLQRAVDSTLAKPLDNSLAGLAIETAGDVVRGAYRGAQLR